MEKDRESEKVEHVDVEENKVFQNLSTSYQQIVDNVGKDIHDTHRGVYPHFFSRFSSKNPLTKADFFYISRRCLIILVEMCVTTLPDNI